MTHHKTITEENRAYWTRRASGYSEVSRLELDTAQRQKWRDCLSRELSQHFPGRTFEDLHILEVGTGPGFFAILLCELGCRVTAVDLTPAMLCEAKKNAGELAVRIRFLEMDAQALSFPDASFDAVVSRNLTWNLPRPELAYAEWARVLKPGGMLMNFDANWYHYLFDASAREGYDADRRATAEQGLADENIGENFDQMERIAMRVPLSRAARPAWDHSVLSKLGLHVTTDTEAWSRVWSAEEKVNFASTPMFLVHAVHPAGP